jgi:hypothetical protein
VVEVQGELVMAVTPAAPPRTTVRHAEVVGIWAVECPCARRTDRDWARELLGGDAPIRATLDADGYELDGFAVDRVGTAYVRLVCGVSVLPGVRTVRGAVEELVLSRARSRRTRGRLIDAAVT